MSRSTLVALVVVLAVLVTGFVVLSVRGVPTADYVLFLSGPIVSALVGVVLAKRSDTLQKATDLVVHQTNSLLTTRLDRLDSGQAVAAGDRAVLRKLEERSVQQTPPEL